MRLKQQKKTEPLGFKISTDETPINKNIELQAENLRLRQDLNWVCNTKFEELVAAVRKSNENLFNENQKLNEQIDIATQLNNQQYEEAKNNLETSIEELKRRLEK